MIARVLSFLTDHPWASAAALFLAGGLLGVLAGRRQTPSLKEEVKSSEAAFGREVLDRKTEEGPKHTVEVVEEFRRRGQPEGDARHTPYIPTPGSVTRSVAPAVPDTGLLRRTTRITDEGPRATETHAESSTAQTSTQSLKLSQEANGASWGLSVGVADLRERQLHLGLRRRLFGPFWLEAAVTPATRAVGAGLAVEW